MAKRLFNKEFFIRSVKYNVRTLFRKEIEEATEQQIFQAVGYAVKDAIMDAWIATQKEYEKSDPKIVYYIHGVPDGTCAGQQPDQSYFL